VTTSFFKFTPEDLAEPEVRVWPENVQTINALVAVGTQWRVGFGGAYGLDYTALPTTLELLGVDKSEWRSIFDGLRICEDAALTEMRSE
jgi:hypothetical protein